MGQKGAGPGQCPGTWAASPVLSLTWSARYMLAAAFLLPAPDPAQGLAHLLAWPKYLGFRTGGQLGRGGRAWRGAVPHVPIQPTISLPLGCLWPQSCLVQVRVRGDYPCSPSTLVLLPSLGLASPPTPLRHPCSLPHPYATQLSLALCWAPRLPAALVNHQHSHPGPRAPPVPLGLRNGAAWPHLLPSIQDPTLQTPQLPPATRGWAGLVRGSSEPGQLVPCQPRPIPWLRASRVTPASGVN